MLVGGCACGAVRYEVTGEISPIIHCHCRTGRKTHASAFSSLAAVPRDLFRWTAGEELLSAFESSPGKFRRFCSRRGSHLFAEREGQGVVMLRLGCLETPITPRHVGHIWRSDGASWFDPSVSLREFPEGYQAARGESGLGDQEK
jgi:hypothetical protein